MLGFGPSCFFRRFVNTCPIRWAHTFLIAFWVLPFDFASFPVEVRVSLFEPGKAKDHFLLS